MTYLRFNKYSVKRILIIEKRNYCINKWIGVSVFNCRKRMILLWLTNDGSYRKELNSKHKACVKWVIQGRPWKQHLTEKMSAIRPPTALQQQIKAAITDCSSTLEQAQYAGMHSVTQAVQMKTCHWGCEEIVSLTVIKALSCVPTVFSRRCKHYGIAIGS